MKRRIPTLIKFIILATLTMLVLSACGSKSTSDTTAKTSKDENKAEQNIENGVQRQSYFCR